MNDETGHVHSFGPGGSDPADPARADGSGGSGHMDEREMEIVDLADVPAQEVILRSIVVLLTAATEKTGITFEDPASSPHFDLDEARKLITALAGLVAASTEYLGPQAGPIKNALQNLQLGFREASAYPDAPGQGPGEKFTGPVY